MSLSKIKVRDLESIAPDSVIGSDGSGNPSIIAKTDLGGVEGKSAYQVAVDEGFAGTEAEWLESLQGEQGVAGADGLSTPNSVTGNESITNSLNNKADLVAVSNVFDKDRVEIGVGYDVNGQDITNTTRFKSHLISAKSNESFSSRLVVERAVAFDGNGVEIDDGGNRVVVASNTRSFTIPNNPNIAFIKVTGTNGTDLQAFIDDFDIRRGDISNPENISYEPFKQILDSQQLSVDFSDVDTSQNKIQLTDIENTVDFFTEDQNIFNNDPSFYTTDRVLGNDGNLAPGTSDLRVTVEKVPLADYVTHIYFRTRDRIAFFDENEDLIGSLIVGGNFVITEKPDNAKFLSYSLLKDTLSDMMIAFSNKFQPFKVYEIPKKTIDNFRTAELNAVEELEVVLPDVIYKLVGVDKDLFNIGTTAVKNYDNYEFIWSSDIPGGLSGAVNNQHGVRILSDTVGNYTLTLTIKDHLGINTVGTAQTTVRIINRVTGARDKNILIIASSLWDDKDDALRKMNTGFTIDGTLENHTFQTVGNQTSPDGYQHEARGGSRAGTYLAAEYEPGVPNPFWNPNTNQVDFNYYQTQLGVTIDLIVYDNGTNGRSQINLNTGINGEANETRTLIEALNNTGASSIPIILANPIMLGTSDRLSSFHDTIRDRIRIIELKKGYKEIANDITNVTHVDQASAFNSRFNYLRPLETPEKIAKYQEVTRDTAVVDVLHPIDEALEEAADNLIPVITELLYNV